MSNPTTLELERLMQQFESPEEYLSLRSRAEPCSEALNSTSSQGDGGEESSARRESHYPWSTSLINDEFTFKGISIPLFLFFVFITCIAGITFILLPQPSTELVYLNPGEQVVVKVSGFWFNSVNLKLESFDHIQDPNISVFVLKTRPYQYRHRNYFHNSTINTDNHEYLYQSYYLNSGSLCRLNYKFNDPVNYVIMSSQEAFKKWKSYGYILTENILLQGSLISTDSLQFVAPSSDYYYILFYSLPSNSIGTISLEILYLIYDTSFYNQKVLLDSSNMNATVDLINQDKAYFIFETTANVSYSWRTPKNTIKDEVLISAYSTNARPGVFAVWWPMWTLTVLVILLMFMSLLIGCFVICSNISYFACLCDSDENDDEEREALLQNEDIEPLPLYQPAESCHSAPSYHSMDIMVGTSCGCSESNSERSFFDREHIIALDDGYVVPSVVTENPPAYNDRSD